MIVAKQIELDYGHTLPNHFSFCNQIHGHRARVVAEVEGPVVHEENSSSEGMVLDFCIIKKCLMEEVHAVLDHGFAVWRNDRTVVEVPAQQWEGGPTVPQPMYKISVLDFVWARNKKVLICSEPPTAEYLAKWAYEKIYDRLRKENSHIDLISITWFETPNSSARYTLGDYGVAHAHVSLLKERA